MVVWQLNFDVDNYTMLVTKEEEACDLLRFDGTSEIETWKPIEVEKADRAKLSNATCLYSSAIPVFDEKVLDIVKDLIKDSVEILPLDFDGKKLYAINVIKILNCLDYEKSEYIKFDDSDRIMVIEKYVFKEECVKGHHIFKIIDEPEGGAFVSDEFRDLVLMSCLTGFKFVKAWDSSEEY